MPTFRPHKTASRATSDEVRRVVRITDQDLADPDPDEYLTLKLLINDFDELEQSDPVAWADAVAAITTPQYRRLFEGENFDRDRYRYLVYGWDRENQAAVYSQLLAAFP